MREFLKDKIFDLYLYCGNRQENKMTNEEIEKLLDVLEKVCKVYDYIPEEKQKEIIEAQLLRDKEYQNINARLISKWLEENGKHFFTQQHHRDKSSEQDYKPLEGEDRDKAIQNYLKELAKVNTQFNVTAIKGSGSKMREQLDQVAPIPQTKPEDSALNEYLTQQANETTNEKGIEGTGEATGLPENSIDTTQSNESI